MYKKFFTSIVALSHLAHNFELTVDETMKKGMRYVCTRLCVIFCVRVCASSYDNTNVCTLWHWRGH